MAAAEPIQIIGREGVRGTSVPLPTNGPDTSHLLIRFEGGKMLWIARDQLTLQADGSYFIDLGPLETASEADGNIVVPVVAEDLEVTTRTIETGRVRIIKEVHERQAEIGEPLVHERVHVERIPINRIVTEAPLTRQEGDTLIVPVIEETLVVAKQLVLKEELRITKTRSVEQGPPQRITLRHEEVRVERIPAPEAAKEGAT